MIFRFDPIKHAYYLGDRRLGTVTGIIKHFIPRWECDRWYLERGSAVHEATEYYDRGTLDEGSVGDVVYGYLEAWKAFRHDYGFMPTDIELQKYHPAYFYAGTIDRLGVSVVLGPSLLDIKTGEPSPADAIQLVGGYREMIGEWDRACYPVYLHSDGTYTKPIPYKDKQMRELRNIWLSMVYTFNYLLREGVITFEDKEYGTCLT